MRYAGKKILTMCVTLFAVTLFVFLAFHMISGDPVTSMLGTQATPERAEALREELGLNDPVLVQYGRWAAGFLKGDMGTSYSYRMPVSEMILDKLPVTITMTLMAFVWMILISIPVGLYAAKHEGGMTDRIITVVNQIIMAVPPFFAGILITFVFGMAVYTGWLCFLSDKYRKVRGISVLSFSCHSTAKGSHGGQAS